MEQSFVEMLEYLDPQAQREMEEKGYVLLDVGYPPDELVKGILNYLHRYDKEPEINIDEPTRLYRGRFRCHFSTVVHGFVDNRVNRVYVLQTFCGVTQKTGKDSEADVVVTNNTRRSRPYRLGPIGYTKAVALILPVNEGLGPENGFFSYCPQSASWTQQEFEERLASEDIPMEEMRVPLNKGLLLLAGLVVQFPATSNCCFVSKTYVPKIQAAGEAQRAFEKEHVVHFMRTTVKYFLIDDWKSN